MTYDEALQKFGLPASPESRDRIRRLLAGQIELEKREEGGEEMLRVLCLQLFSLGSVEDALLIWEAKQSSFDACCGLDIQLLCGAGLEATKGFLAKSGDPAAPAALDYLIECEEAGDFEGWLPRQSIDHYRKYYGI